MVRPRAVLASLLVALSGCPRTATTVPKTQVSIAPSESTLRVIGSLKKELRVRVFASVGIGAIDALLPSLESLLSQYRAHGGGRVRVDIVRPERLDLEDRKRVEGEALALSVRRAKLREPSDVGGSPFAPTEGYLAVVLTYGAERVVLFQDDGLDARFVDRLDLRLRMAMREAIARDEHRPIRIGWLGSSSDLEAIAAIERESPHLHLERIDSGSGEHPIDPMLRGLIVVQPKEMLQKRMLQRIDEVLMAGRTVAILASGVVADLHDAKLAAKHAFLGLDDLLARYGVRTHRALVVDRRQFWVPQLDTDGFTLQLDPYPFVFVAPRAGERRTYDDRFTPLLAIPELVVPLPTELSLVPRTDAAIAREVVYTLPSVVLASSDPIALLPRGDLLAIGPRREEQRRVVLGVTIEGAIRSAFSGADGQAQIAKPSARLFVLSTGAPLGNFFAEAALAQSVPEDDPLRRYAVLYQRLRPSLARVLKQTCEWMADD